MQKIRKVALGCGVGNIQDGLGPFFYDQKLREESSPCIEIEIKIFLFYFTTLLLLEDPIDWGNKTSIHQYEL